MGDREITYLFDIDGTLTFPRKTMSDTFSSLFRTWSKGKRYFFVTGSDYSKVIEQVPEDIILKSQGTYCCMGNELRDPTGEVLYNTKMMITTDLLKELKTILNESKYSVRTGNHTEFRTGMINFSTVGRNANSSQREEYEKWDKQQREREAIAARINDSFSEYEASVGGTISIDIIEKGNDKGQVVEDLIANGRKKVVFVGDKTQKGGNDYGVVRELERSELAFEWHQVNSPFETATLLVESKVFQ